MSKNISASEVLNLRTKSGLSQHAFGERLGVTRNYVSMLERGTKEVSRSSSIGLLFEILRQEIEGERPSVIPLVAREELDKPAPRLVDPYSPYQAAQRALRHLRTIPLLGWAHAGRAASYEELPPDWQDQIPTDCPDPHAFAVTLEGNSQEPLFLEGSRLTLMPTYEVYTGCQCVLKLADDGVLCRRVEIVGNKVRLHAENPAYDVQEHDRDAIQWMYRIWGSWTQVYR